MKSIKKVVFQLLVAGSVLLLAGCNGTLRLIPMLF